VIARARKWNTRKNCGLVVGATRPKELRRIRSLVPDMPLLIPGVGAQGGDVRSAVRYGCASDGMMAIINASRSIIYASRGEDFARAAREAALALRDEMNVHRRRYFAA
jgi:orotidine-5'-phosphate decarboxylase